MAHYWSFNGPNNLGQIILKQLVINMKFIFCQMHCVSNRLFDYATNAFTYYCYYWDSSILRDDIFMDVQTPLDDFLALKCLIGLQSRPLSLLVESVSNYWDKDQVRSQKDRDPRQGVDSLFQACALKTTSANMWTNTIGKNILNILSKTERLL